MIAMGMGDDCLVHRPPGVDVESALWAIEPAICEFDERHVINDANNRPNTLPSHSHPAS